MPQPLLHSLYLNILLSTFFHCLYRRLMLSNTRSLLVLKLLHLQMRAIHFRLLLLVASVTIHPREQLVSVCSSSRLTDIDNKLHDISVLSKQSPSGVWLLSANLVIAKGATFHIDSTDTKWLKINSKVDRKRRT